MIKLRHILFLILAALSTAVLPASAAVYTVDDVPNVQLADRSRHVTNPDGILSQQAQDSLDIALRALRDSTSSEMVVVAIDDIYSADADNFATELFEKWGLGKSDRDNGLLLLIVKDQHNIVIRTGRGIEGVLPDVACGRIIRNIIAPAFRNDDFDAGTIAAVDAISAILRDPATIDEVLSDRPDISSDEEPISSDDILAFMLDAGMIMALALIIALLWVLRSTRGQSMPERWSKLWMIRTLGLFASFLGIGIPLIAFIPTLLVMRRMRHRHSPCPNCGTRMHRLDEQSDNQYLTAAQDKEEHLNSIDYDVWLCRQCGTTDVIPFINRTSSYTACPACGARACTLARDRVVVPPSTSAEGRGVRTFACLNCHHSHDMAYRIAKLATPIIIGGGSGGNGGGGFSGGGFGGGITGGGGASGGW